MKDAEQIVDEMIADGKRVMAEVIAAVRPVQIVAAYSSGDDSIVSTHFAMSNYGDAFVFNADTLTGLEPSRCHLRSVCQKLKWQLEINEAHAEGPPKKMRQGGRMVPFDAKFVCPTGVWNDGASAYEEYCLNFGFPGRGKPQHARMYQRLKERPFRRMLKQFDARKRVGGNKVLIISGIRHDESSNRAGYQRAWAEGYFGDVWVNPFYWRTKADFEMYRQEFGLPRNPVKRLTGISGECTCGTFGDADERQAYRVADPAYSAKLDALEADVKALGFPWGWGESPPRWWVQEQERRKRGQPLLFDDSGTPEGFQPMCVGCNNGRR